MTEIPVQIQFTARDLLSGFDGRSACHDLVFAAADDQGRAGDVMQGLVGVVLCAGGSLYDKAAEILWLSDVCKKRIEAAVSSDRKSVV